jgi:hypothetical protein
VRGAPWWRASGGKEPTAVGRRSGAGHQFRGRGADRELNGGLLFRNTWSCGLRMVLLKEEGGA